VAVAAWQAVLLVAENHENDVRSFSLLTTPLYLPQIPIAVGLVLFGIALAGEACRLAPPRSRRRLWAVPVIALAAVAALAVSGGNQARAPLLGVAWGFVWIAAAVLAAAWAWNGWRATVLLAAVLVAAAAALYGSRGLPAIPAALTLAALAGALLAAGMRISLALGTVGMLAIAFQLPSASLFTIAERSWDSLDSFTLTAIPMFVLMGAVLMKSGLTELMLDALGKWVGGVSGGIAYSSISACAIFAAVSGSSVATAAAIGMAACPEMIRRGYSPTIAYGSIAAGGTLGILIPPSIVMILYGSTVGVPIATLFMAGVLPGIVLTLLFMLVVLAWTLLRPQVAPAFAQTVTWAEKVSSLTQILPLVLLIVAVLAMLYAGVATPTEAAAIATMASLAICWWRGRLTLGMLRETLLESVVITAFLLFIVVGAAMLAYAFDYQRLPALLVEGVKASALSPGAVLVAIAIPVILLGMFLDPIAMIVMTLPVLFPLAVALGFDPVWFGVVIVLLVELSLICPPLGMNLIVLKSVAGASSMRDLVLGVLPFMAMMVAFIWLLYVFPDLATWLPRTMGAT
jgi:tripartite ATP-independent transporter DctM subunit